VHENILIGEDIVKYVKMTLECLRLGKVWTFIRNGAFASLLNVQKDCSTIDTITECLMTRQNDDFAPSIGFRVFMFRSGANVKSFHRFRRCRLSREYPVETTNKMSKTHTNTCYFNFFIVGLF
jgi:hypothetical protein